MNLDVIGFGALNLDRLFHVNQIACKDEEGYVLNLEESCGGSAANTIIGLSRLGLKTGFIGKIASDAEGKMLLANLNNENVNTEGIIQTSKGRSGTVHGYVDRDGERALYVDPGVNDNITIQEINQEFTSNIKLLHLTSFVGQSIKAQEALLENLPSQVKVSLDPGMIYANKGIERLTKILYRTNILLINQKELDILLSGLKDLEDKINTILNFGINITVIKQGENGCLVIDGHKKYLIDAFKVDCKDTTGAGDAFNSGFIHGIIEGKNIKESALIGNFVASCCIQELGATTGLPRKPALRDLNNQ